GRPAECGVCAPLKGGGLNRESLQERKRVSVPRQLPFRMVRRAPSYVDSLSIEVNDFGFDVNYDPAAAELCPLLPCYE
ncbi:MAG: hypothetical protein LC114_27470, partial [Bryobacterales bacterium]|nr:hypothetical protein [Bryobacterales bacterium]